jgi:methyl-accepting chemotaxis protein-1 (serine sensor receptor)
MFANLTIRTRLIGTMLLLGALMIFIGVRGITALSTTNNVLKDVYQNSMVSMKAIADAQIQIDRARLSIDRVALKPDAPNAEETITRAQGFLEASDKAWARYTALPFGEGEKPLADQTGAARTTLIKDGVQAAIKALRDKNQPEIDRMMLSEVTRLFRLYTDAAEKLSVYQLESTAKQYEDSQSAYNRNMTFAIVAIVLGLIVALVSSILLLRAVMNPLGEALKHFNAISDGNLANTIDLGRKDEMGALMTGLHQMQDRLADTVRSVRDGSDAIATASNEIAAGNMDLSRRTEQQAASLEETASSLEELTSTVKQNSDNARQANQLVGSASDIAVKGGELVSRVVDTMASITESSDKIADIIGVIDGIAFQTNILALNAAVEAARAGEQGRGFAVVATEVRNLAHRSASAAKDIKQLITDSVEKVGTGSALVNEAGTTMTEIVTSVRRVTQIMGEITSAGREQELGIEQINTAVAEMDTVTQQNAALVEEAAAASQAMQEQAVKLAEMVSVFQIAGSPARAAAPRPAAKPAAARPAPAARPVTAKPAAKAPSLKLADKPSRSKPAASSDGDWEEF